LLGKPANVYNADESGFPLNNKPPDKVFAGFNAKERVKSGTMKSVLGREAGISLCVKMADFNPYHIKSNMLILFLYIQINI
jgi:hypothetical protein